MHVLNRFWVLSLLLAVLCPPDAFGDGECPGGIRDTTAAERQLIATTLESLRAALPPSIEGWAIGGYEEISARQSICRDTEATPWAYNFSRTFNRIDDTEERDRAVAEAAAAIRAAHMAKQPKIDAITAKGAALGEALAAAAQNGDQARIDAINQELAQLQTEFATIYSGDDNQAHNEALAVAMNQDRQIIIQLAVNDVAHSNDAAEPVAPPPGATRAYRWQTTVDGVTTGHTLVLLGNWQPQEGGGFPPGRREGVSSAAAHAIAVHVSADPARLDAMVAAIDFGAIGAMARGQSDV